MIISRQNIVRFEMLYLTCARINAYLMPFILEKEHIEEIRVDCFDFVKKNTRIAFKISKVLLVEIYCECLMKLALA